jgi:hypothetical protein
MTPKAALLPATVIAPFGCFEDGCQTPDEQNCKNKIRRGVENERENERRRHDANDQDRRIGFVDAFLNDRQTAMTRCPNANGA